MFGTESFFAWIRIRKIFPDLNPYRFCLDSSKVRSGSGFVTIFKILCPDPSQIIGTGEHPQPSFFHTWLFFALAPGTGTLPSV